MRAWTLSMALILGCGGDETTDITDMMGGDDNMTTGMMDDTTDPTDDNDVMPTSDSETPPPPPEMIVDLRFANLSRFIAGGVDIFVDGDPLPLMEALAPIEGTGIRTGRALGIMPGTHAIGFSPAGQNVSFGWTALADFAAGYYSAAVMGDPPNVQIDIAFEDVTTLPPGMVRLRVVNATSAGTVVTLTDATGPVVADALAFGAASAEIDVPVAARNFTLDVGSDGTDDYGYVLPVPAASAGKYVPVYITSQTYLAPATLSDSAAAPSEIEEIILAVYTPQNTILEVRPTEIPGSTTTNPAVSTSDSGTAATP